MSDVTETPLPGVGTRFDFTTAAGQRVGVVVHHGGRRDLLLYSSDDPDASAAELGLAPEDLLTLVDVLGGSRVTAHLEAVEQRIEGLAIDWIEVAATSALSGRTLAESSVHTRTGVSIVAVLRERGDIPAPDARTVLEPGDRVVAVGTPEGLEQLRRELSGRE